MHNIFWPCVHQPTHANEQQEIRDDLTKFYQTYKGIIVDVNATIGDTPIRCKMPAQTIKLGYANFTPSRESLHKIGYHGNVPWPMFTKLLARFFIDGVNTTTRVAIRPSVVERQGRHSKRIK